VSEIKLPVKYEPGMGYMDASDGWVGPSQIVPAINSIPALVEALRAARRELNCLIDQAAARGYTSGGPKEVVEKINEALKGAE
jgi:hypothetical protein